MKPLALIAAFALAAISTPAFALERLVLGTQEVLDSVPTVVVPAGHSVVLEFQNGDFIQSIWVDDQSILAAAPDRPLCNRETGISESCGFASLIRLRRLNGALAISGSSFSQNGDPTTVLTIITTNDSGGDQQTYQFTVITTDQRSSPYSHIAIAPSQSVSQFDILAIEKGIQHVIAAGLADQDSIEWSRLLRFRELIQSKVPLALALQNSAVNESLLLELQRLGGGGSPLSTRSL